MELSQLLQIQPGITAIIGSGGKTTMLYTLAAELQSRGRVICTTTTHIFPPDHMPLVLDGNAVDIRRALEATSCLCVGSMVQEGKLGPGPLPAAELAALADYVLVEADGSRHLPIKAHASHEPVIPEGTGFVIQVVGASGFGQPIEKVVHRPEQFCAITGLRPGDIAAPAAVAQVIQGENFAQAVFVNQAENVEQWAAAQELAAGLRCPVYAGALMRGDWKRCAL